MSGVLYGDQWSCAKRAAVNKSHGPTLELSYANFTESNFDTRGNWPRKLQRCEGDCDEDSDCEGGLMCFLRNLGGTVPGCFSPFLGSPSEGTSGDSGGVQPPEQDINMRRDYCYEPVGREAPDPADLVVAVACFDNIVGVTLEDGSAPRPPGHSAGTSTSSGAATNASTAQPTLSWKGSVAFSDNAGHTWHPGSCTDCIAGPGSSNARGAASRVSFANPATGTGSGNSVGAGTDKDASVCRSYAGQKCTLVPERLPEQGTSGPAYSKLYAKLYTYTEETCVADGHGCGGEAEYDNLDDALGLDECLGRCSNRIGCNYAEHSFKRCRLFNACAFSSTKDVGNRAVKIFRKRLRKRNYAHCVRVTTLQSPVAQGTRCDFAGRLCVCESATHLLVCTARGGPPEPHTIQAWLCTLLGQESFISAQSALQACVRHTLARLRLNLRPTRRVWGLQATLTLR